MSMSLIHNPTSRGNESDDSPDFVAKDGYYEKIGQELGKLVDEKQKAYGNSVSVSIDVLEAFLKPYEAEGFYNGEQTVYILPKSLLRHLLLQVRIIDKQCRIFSNPAGDLMGESPYRDIAGYGLIGTGTEENQESEE